VTAEAAEAVASSPTAATQPASSPLVRSLFEIFFRRLIGCLIAVNASSMPATILLRPGKRYELTRRGAGEDRGDLDMTSGPLTVKTKGGGKTNPATIDANGIDRIFDGSLTLNGVTLRDGHAHTVAGDSGAGGAIRGDVLDIRNSRLIKNTADYHPSNSFPNGAGGAIFVNNGGELRIAGTRLKGNRALGPGGAIFISKGGSASLFKSTVAHTTSRPGPSEAGWPSTRVGAQRSTAPPSPATRRAVRVPVAALACMPRRRDRRRHS
jgi:hypothetical protein